MALLNNPEDPFAILAPEPEPPPAPPSAPPAPGGGTGGGAPAPPGVEDPFRLPQGYFNFGTYEGPSGSFSIPDAPTAPTISPFTAPTLEQAMASPGYQMRLRAGEQALQRSAAARGLLRTGGTLRDLTDYSQASAANEYGSVFDRAMQAYRGNTEATLGAYGHQLDRYRTQTGFERDRALGTANIAFNAFSAREAARRRAIELLASIGSNIYLNNDAEPGRNEPLPPEYMSPGGFGTGGFGAGEPSFGGGGGMGGGFDPFLPYQEYY